MPYVRLAREYQYGFVLESFTWRANRDWAERLGISEPELSDVTLESIRFLEEIREQYDCEATPSSFPAVWDRAETAMIRGRP